MQQTVIDTKQAIAFGFASPKGGVGKSALTKLFPNWLNFIKGETVMVIDADPQGTVIKQRLSDVGEFDLDSWDSAYPVEVLNPEDVFNHIKINRKHFDFIAVDLAGTLSTKGNIRAYAALDKIIMPNSTSKDDLQEIEDFINLINEKVTPVRMELGLKPTEIVVTLNRIDKVLKEYKEITRLRKLPAEKIKQDIEAMQRGEFNDIEYYHPFRILDPVADITESKGVFGQDINTVITENNILIAERFGKQCEAFYKFLTS